MNLKNTLHLFVASAAACACISAITASAAAHDFNKCISAPLPTTPKTPSWTATGITFGQGAKEAFNVTVWREACEIDPALSVILMQMMPTRGAPMQFTPTIIQDGLQYGFSNFRFYTGPSSDVGAFPLVAGNQSSDQLFVPVTVLLQQTHAQSMLLDENGPMTMYFGFNGVRLEVPAKNAQANNTIPLSLRGGIDLDGQGRSALLVRSFTNSGLQAGRLVSNKFQWSSLADPGIDYRIIAPIDFGGRGKSDLPMLRQEPLNAGGQGVAQFWSEFSSERSVVMRGVRPTWDVQAVGDLDGDGFGDLVWRFKGTSENIDDQGVSYVWFTNGTGVTQVRKRGGAPLNWTLLGAIDLNGDRAADMVYLSPGNGISAGTDIRILMATPNRTCANLSGGLAIPADFTALKLADFSGSGRGDILIRNTATGEVKLVSLDAAGLPLPSYTGAPDDLNAGCTPSTSVLRQTVRSIGTANPTWTYYASGDFDGDGIFDIIWQRPNGTMTVWLFSANAAAPTVINDAGQVLGNTNLLPLQ